VSGIKAKIEEANQKTLDVLLRGQPVLVDIRPALEVVPGMTENMVLHSAPPIEWKRMCGPHRHGIAGAVVWEGLADTHDDAVSMIERGEILVEPCHHHDTVGAGAGITSATTPMLVVENKSYGNRAYSCLSEGGGLQLIKWGSYDEKIAENLTWQANVLRPVLQAAVLSAGGVDVKSIIAKAVQMGDECHNRSIAASAVFFREIAPHLLNAHEDRNVVLSCTESLAASEHFFLHAIMAAAKAVLNPAKNIPYSTVVTAMARNGVEFGIQVSGLDDVWFTAPANDVDGLFFRSEWGPEDAAPDLGDSCITETIGLGGFIQAAAPTVQQYVQGSMQDAISNTNEMREICVGTNQEVQIPAMDFAGGPIGIDIRKVVKTRIAPLIDTAITHKDHGLIGAGQVRAPLECFDKAIKAFSSKYSAG
jgi:hypothetical protein